MLAVSDTGIGLDEETKSHIFEPFFTTKEKGKGTGLGLATVYGIVKQSRGHIAVYSEVGHGTTFKVYLPRVKSESTSGTSGPTIQKRGKGGAETIMLVEDEKVVQELAVTLLEEYGYTVLAASDGEEALTIIESRSQRPDLLITDVVMPGMGGKELAERVQSRWPEMRIIFISGYADEAIIRQGVLETDAQFLQKPFAPEALAKKVRNILDGKSDQELDTKE
jgi:CheY-like chemotaxis protein